MQAGLLCRYLTDKWLFKESEEAASNGTLLAALVRAGKMKKCPKCGDYQTSKSDQHCLGPARSDDQQSTRLRGDPSNAHRVLME